MDEFTDGARRHVKRGTKRAERHAAQREIARMLAEDALGDLPDAMDVLHEEALRENEIFDAAREDYWGDDGPLDDDPSEYGMTLNCDCPNCITLTQKEN